jgi:AAA family ATP:ADP antiporter
VPEPSASRRPSSGGSSAARGTPGTGLAIATALAMIAYQVAARATRDALFLSSFSATSLPAMTIASATLSILMAFVGSKALSRFGPQRVIPMGFAGSAFLLLVEWMLLRTWPRPVVIAVYLHYGGLGALLVSGFWAFLNERFDPRTAKRALGRVAAGGTIGGLVGGLLADRVGSAFTVATMLPILATIHMTCAALIVRMRESAPSTGGSVRAAARPSRAPAGGAAGIGAPESGLRILRGSPYLRTLVALVLLVTVSEGLVDWLFKARASTAMVRGEELLRLFGAFYMGTSLLTVIVQAVFSRLALERLGLARSVATLPAAVGLGSLGILAWPGLGSALALRATESVVSNSLYRGSYEVLFTPVPAREKRAVKTLVDVGAARAGDFAGALIIQIILIGAGLGNAVAFIVLTIAAVCVAALFVANRLHAGYVRALERGLVSRAAHLDRSEASEATTGSMVLQSLGALDLSQAFVWQGAEGERGTASTPPASHTPSDPAARREAALTSGRAAEVRGALREGRLPLALVPRAITLLAWDEVAREAIEALRSAGDVTIPALASALSDPGSDFAIRRRVPLVLGVFADATAVEALLTGLADKRFEVRYRCGRALHHLVTTFPRLSVPPDRVFEAVLRDLGTERAVWEGQRLLDQLEDEAWAPAFDEALRSRASRSLEHVFTLLSLAFPRQPLQIAYRGLHTQDSLLRGTALEYLETTLPPEIRKRLWPYLEDTRPKRVESRPVGDVLADLLQSNQSIAIHLDALRRQETPGPETPRPGARGPS